MDEFDGDDPADSQINLWTRIACVILMVGITLCGVSICLLTGT